MYQLEGIEKLVDRILEHGRLEDLEEFVAKITFFHERTKRPYSAYELFVMELYCLRCEEHITFETVAGVYLPNDIVKHRYVNDLLLERAAPGQVLPEGDMVSMREYKSWSTPYAQSSEMQAAGLKTGKGENQYTLVNTVAAPVNNVCDSGYQLLIGNENAAVHYNMSLRSFERWNPPGVRKGTYMVRNVSSCDHHRKTIKK